MGSWLIWHPTWETMYQPTFSSATCRGIELICRVFCKLGLWPLDLSKFSGFVSLCCFVRADFLVTVLLMLMMCLGVLILKLITNSLTLGFINFLLLLYSWSIYLWGRLLFLNYYQSLKLFFSFCEEKNIKLLHTIARKQIGEYKWVFWFFFIFFVTLPSLLLTYYNS